MLHVKKCNNSYPAVIRIYYLLLFSSAIFSICSVGLFIGISVSWYAGEVIYEFYAFTYQTVRMKYTLGACIYVGWISMVVSLICGFLMICWIFCNKSDDDDDFESRNYLPPSFPLTSGGKTVIIFSLG